MNIEVSCATEPRNLAIIAAGLGRHVTDVGVEPRNAQSLFAMLHDQQGQLVAGLSAMTSWGWLHIKELWVDENVRGSDIGSRLMHAAESEARSRGCHHALLDTFDFQARPFYEKLGYTVFGELADFPRGHCRYFMRKHLSDNSREHGASNATRAPS